MGVCQEREQLEGDDWSTEVEEQPLLEDVVKKLLLKTL
jgi:hypothetical protein